MKGPQPEAKRQYAFRHRVLSGWALSVMASVAGVPDGMAADSGGMPGVQASTALQGKQDDQALNFDSDFLGMGGGGAGKHVDLSYFAHKGGMLPGRYAVQVKVNGKVVDDGRVVEFRSRTDEPGKLYACVNAGQLAEWWGVIASRKGEEAPAQKVAPVPAGDNGKGDGQGQVSAPSGEGSGGDATRRAVALPDANGKVSPVKAGADDGHDTTCPVNGIEAMVPYAKEVFDFNKQTLSLTVPQASLGPASRLRTPPHLWDEGMPAILMNYNYSGSQQNSRGQKRGSDFLGLNGQLNLLGWRIRNGLTWHRSQGQGNEWNASQVYAQRDFERFGGGQVTVGHTTSTGGGVDSVQFTGVRLDSDEGMLDPKYTTYRPAITGIANSPATVTVRQYGKVIYQQNVPQGPFSLTDFNRSGNGDVDVEIREADGSTRHFTMAQASSATLMQRGASAWSASSGRAVSSTGYADDKFVQAGMSYGAWANTTLTGGVLVSRNYQALSVGTGVYAGAWGAVSYTLKTSRADLSVVPGQGGPATGVSHDISWSRSFGDTSVGASWSHAQTRDFHSYSELLSMKAREPGEKEEASAGTRDSYSLSLSQSLGIWGSVSLSGTRSTTWGSDAVQNNVSLSYNTTVRDVGIGVSLGYSTMNGSSRADRDDDNDSPVRFNSDRDNRTDRSVALTVSLPLGKWLNANSVSGNYSYSRYNGTVSQQAGVSGSALNGAMSWSASQSLTGTKTGNASAGYSGRLGSVSGGYSYGGGSNSLSYGLNGGLAIHPHGVTLGRQVALSGGNALVEIPGVSGVGVNGAVTDWRGYALVGGLTPYDRNRINVDMTNLPGNIELDASSKNVIPTRGALVAVPFRGNKGYRLMITLKRSGDEVPFGSTASLKQDDANAMPVTGIVGDAGQVYMSGVPEKGTLIATWGDGKDAQCTATWTLPAKADMERLNEITIPCQ
ncbi:fimbrial biogenesis outer membrane usher protein [Citrobacter freundii]|uniref:fimbria/pilus outer membrane usher protein n=1 Tax=Klebsiella aerogenes TaxID=548 RepID=UPI0009B84190|nr:fimbria/pilus outer membrane usher protein [Klebsiella aerogenes]EGT0627986.1 fimbrial biogenesis outer membrane usher protein [Citrobacter freundii]